MYSRYGSSWLQRTCTLFVRYIARTRMKIFIIARLWFGEKSRQGLEYIDNSNWPAYLQQEYIISRSSSPQSKSFSRLFYHAHGITQLENPIIIIDIISITVPNTTAKTMYSPPNSSSTRRSIATRQRVSRACDRCNHLRVKCDGQRPCEHCLGELFVSATPSSFNNTSRFVY